MLKYLSLVILVFCNKMTYLIISRKYFLIFFILEWKIKYVYLSLVSREYIYIYDNVKDQTTTHRINGKTTLFHYNVE
jgi:hypothetical protein